MNNIEITPFMESIFKKMNIVIWDDSPKEGLVRVKCKMPSYLTQNNGYNIKESDKFIALIEEWAKEVGIVMLPGPLYFNRGERGKILDHWLVYDIAEEHLSLLSLKWGLEYSPYDPEVDRDPPP